MAKPRNDVRQSKQPSSEDALAFREAVRDIKPLTHTPPAEGLAKPRVAKRARHADAVSQGALDALMPLIDTTSLPDVAGDLTTSGAVTAAQPLSFQRAGVRTQVVRRLRRGLYPIEDELDLHGLTQTHARQQLAQFLEASRDAGRRCVRIIHGKGYRSGARGPILKIAVNLWLRRHSDVMAFESAKAIDGGTGAVYVLLRA